MPVVMIGGTTDKICATGDYNELRDILKKQNSLLEFISVEYGHLSMLNPNFDYVRKKN